MSCCVRKKFHCHNFSITAMEGPHSVGCFFIMTVIPAPGSRPYAIIFFIISHHNHHVASNFSFSVFLSRLLIFADCSITTRDLAAKCIFSLYFFVSRNSYSGFLIGRQVSHGVCVLKEDYSLKKSNPQIHKSLMIQLFDEIFGQVSTGTGFWYTPISRVKSYCVVEKAKKFPERVFVISLRGGGS